ncbi:DUF6894 family protein [Agrobacterium radiobacter]
MFLSRPAKLTSGRRRYRLSLQVLGFCIERPAKTRRAVPSSQQNRAAAQWFPISLSPDFQRQNRLRNFSDGTIVAGGVDKLHEKTGNSAMPRYFFHVRDAEGLSVDTEGAMLSDDERACIEAVQAAREMLAEKILKNEVVDGAEFEVVRGDGVLVAKIPLKSVVRFE